MTTETNILQQQIKAKEEEFEEFVYIVSHDLKTPMRAINNLVSWIEDDLPPNLNGDVTQNFALLKNRVKRMENMMGSLSELSRVNRMELGIENVKIDKLIKEVIELIEGKRNISLEIQSDLPELNTYGRKLFKVFYNIIENSYRFHHKNEGKIQVSCKDEEEYFMFSIKDDGPGIPKDAFEKVFKIFYTENSKDHVESTGAGLSIAKKIIQFAGGKILLNPDVVEGTEIIFTWPKQIINCK